jgi:hypothetical protein
MGFKRDPKQYRLKWAEGHEFYGLEVTMRSLPINEFLQMTELTTKDATDVRAAQELFRTFGSALLDWNLEDEKDEPVPATYDGVIAQDLDFIMAIVMAWMTALSEVAPPLPQSSDAGNLPSVASLPMVTLP